MLGGSGGAQDIAQETFARLYRKGDPRMPATEARFWVYRVARNLALNELNKMRTRNQLSEIAQTALHPRKLNPGEEYELTERREILLGLLESLPEHQRAVLLLREQQEMSYAQIARVLNITESKVKVDIHRARIALRAKWSEIYNRRERSGSEEVYDELRFH